MLLSRASLAEGRAFTVQDDAAADDAAPRVVVANESFVRQFFADRNPIGQRTDRA